MEKRTADELNRVLAALPDNYSDSKDWTHGDAVERIEWLKGHLDAMNNENKMVWGWLSNEDNDLMGLICHRLVESGLILQELRECYMRGESSHDIDRERLLRDSAAALRNSDALYMFLKHTNVKRRIQNEMEKTLQDMHNLPAGDPMKETLRNRVIVMQETIDKSNAIAAMLPQVTSIEDIEGFPYGD